MSLYGQSRCRATRSTTATSLSIQVISYKALQMVMVRAAITAEILVWFYLPPSLQAREGPFAGYEFNEITK